MSLSAELREFAESPDRFVDVADDGLVTRYDDGRICMVAGADVRLGLRAQRRRG